MYARCLHYHKVEESRDRYLQILCHSLKRQISLSANDIIISTN